MKSIVVLMSFLCLGFSQLSAQTTEEKIAAIDKQITEAVANEDYAKAAELKNDKKVYVAIKEALANEDYAKAAELKKQLGGASTPSSNSSSFEELKAKAFEWKEKNNTDSAEVYFLKAYELKNDDIEVLIELANNFLIVGKDDGVEPEFGIKCIQKALELDKSHKTYYAAGRFYLLRSIYASIKYGWTNDQKLKVHKEAYKVGREYYVEASNSSEFKYLSYSGLAGLAKLAKEYELASAWYMAAKVNAKNDEDRDFCIKMKNEMDEKAGNKGQSTATTQSKPVSICNYSYRNFNEIMATWGDEAYEATYNGCKVTVYIKSNDNTEVYRIKSCKKETYYWWRDSSDKVFRAANKFMADVAFKYERYLGKTNDEGVAVKAMIQDHFGCSSMNIDF